MNLYRRNDSRAAQRRLLVATGVVLAIFALDALSGGALRNLARAGAAPLSRGASRALSAISTGGFFASRRAFVQENDALKQENADLQLRAAGFSVLQQQNAALRAIAHLAENNAGITAPIVSSFFSSPYGTFMVGAGNAEGIAVGSLVLIALPAQESEGSGMFVMGIVREVGAHLSLVKEVFAPNESHAATIRGTPVTLEGQGGGNARADVLHALPIATGDPVVSPELGGRAIGIVGAVREDSAQTRKTIYIRLPINLAAIQYVYIIPTP